ncbi:single myb histone 1-like isoform X2 [Salvia miltiorrhiza]|nr:single myb histone 1-like isoform X2 [Salvia miltiorrhiza]
MNCMANGLGSRRAGVVHKNSQVAPKHDEGTSMDSLAVEKDPVVLDAKPLSEVYVTTRDANLENQISRMDDLILDAITKLKELRGSSRHAIAKYIEDHHSMPPDLERILTANLMALTEKGRLVKVKHQYRIAPRSISLDKGEDPTSSHADGAKDYVEGLRNGIIILTKAQIFAELEKMRSMTAEEAAAVAARAVAEAEAAMAAAEVAAVEAEEAEIEAEAAQCFADAAQKALTCVSFRSARLEYMDM